MRLAPLVFIVMALAGSPGRAAPPEFLNAFSGQPMATPLKDGEKDTEALKRFKATGANAYLKDRKALGEGKALYEQWCQVCHDANGKGKMGPSLLGPAYAYPQSATDVGMFAVIYGGASGAMQAFAKREITQDEILKVVAYVRSLPK